MLYSTNIYVMINLIDSRYSTHGLLLCFISFHISNSSVSASLVGHVLYLADLMSAIYTPYFYLMVYRYIYSRYSSVFLMLYQLYHSLPFSTLILSSSLYLKLQPELLLKVVTMNSWIYFGRSSGLDQVLYLFSLILFLPLVIISLTIV